MPEDGRVAVGRTAPKNQWRRRVLVAFFTVFMALIAAEALARWGLGLGDPPLFVADPEIKYLYKPSQRCSRRHNQFITNRWSMRSEDFPQSKADPREFRVLLIGDSVINGGAFTDQSELASELLKERLASELPDRRVIVGNISAGGWGTPNQLAYIKRYGLFDADVVIIVLSSEDWEDFGQLPLSGAPGSEDFPQKAPLLALQEVVMRYLPRYLPRWMTGRAAAPSATQPRQPTRHEIDTALSALDQMLTRCRESGAVALVAMHWVQSELRNGLEPGHDALREIAELHRVSVLEIGAAFKAAVIRGEQPYRDEAHPNALGQRIIADELLRWFETQP